MSKIESRDILLVRADAALRDATARLEAEVAARHQAEAGLLAAASRTLARLAELGEPLESIATLTQAVQDERRERVAERQALQAAHEAALAALREEAAALCARVELAESHLRAIQSSLTWRVTAPVRDFLNAHPGGLAALRRLRAVAGRVRRGRG